MYRWSISGVEVELLHPSLPTLGDCALDSRTLEALPLQLLIRLRHRSF